MLTESLFTTGRYFDLLGLTCQVVESLKGTPTSDHRWPDCQQLAVKLFFHAASVYWLMQGTRVPGLLPSGGPFFFDFASVAVLVRSVLETYLSMFEVFFQPKTDDEFEFDHALWLLSGFVLREEFSPSDPNLQGDYANARVEVSQMRARIKTTGKYKSLTPGQQKEVLKGTRKRKWQSIAKATGFGEETIRHMYSYFSGYAHADGLSGTQIVTAQTAEEQKALMRFPMSIVMIVLSKMILAYANKFPDAKNVYDKDGKTFRMANVLSEMASRLP